MHDSEVVFRLGVPRLGGAMVPACCQDRVTRNSLARRMFNRDEILCSSITGLCGTSHQIEPLSKVPEFEIFIAKNERECLQVLRLAARRCSAEPVQRCHDVFLPLFASPVDLA